MDYPKLVELIPVEKRETVTDKLVEIILSSKHGDEMPRGLANTFLQQWQQNLLTSELGLSTLLEMAVLLEQEKSLLVLGELHLDKLAQRINGEV